MGSIWSWSTSRDASNAEHMPTMAQNMVRGESGADVEGVQLKVEGGGRQLSSLTTRSQIQAYSAAGNGSYISGAGGRKKNRVEFGVWSWRLDVLTRQSERACVACASGNKEKYHQQLVRCMSKSCTSQAQARRRSASEAAPSHATRSPPAFGGWLDCQKKTTAHTFSEISCRISSAVSSCFMSRKLFCRVRRPALVTSLLP